MLSKIPATRLVNNLIIFAVGAARLKPLMKETEDKDARIKELESELDRARQEMKSFSYSVSHDLRAPLRAMEGFARILSEDYAHSLDDEGRKFLDHIVQNAQVMSGLIEGLLKYHRLNEKPIAPQPVAMTQLTRDILASLKKPGAEPTIKLPPLPTIKGDPALIRIAWEQLIDNALKFSKRHATPEIEFGSKDGDGQNVLWIKDNGVGFDMQYSNKLFQVFQKLQKDADFEGHGIGLALARRVAEIHAGRVWAEATPNGGATFFFAVSK